MFWGGGKKHKVSTVPEKGLGFKTISKYFIHGFAFSVLFLGLYFVWVFLLVVFVVIGLFIGLIIGVVLLFFIIGGLNSFLTDNIWGIPIKTGWKSLLQHGFILFFLLLIVHIPAIVININPNLILTIALFIVYAFIDGSVAKYVAGWWREYEEEKKPKPSPYKWITR